MIGGRLFSGLAIPLLGIRVKVEGVENLDQRPCVFISNHQNNLDLVAMGNICPPRTVTLGKKELLLIPVFGLVYWLCGNILIDRGHKRKARKSMEKVTSAIRDKNISVWIMPEGTRSRGRGLLPFKKGAFRTAVDASVPIVPICFNNYHSSLELNNWFSGTIHCRVLEPVETQGLGREDVDHLMEKSFSLMSECIKELDEITNSNLNRLRKES